MIWTSEFGNIGNKSTDWGVKKIIISVFAKFPGFPFLSVFFKRRHSCRLLRILKLVCVFPAFSQIDFFYVWEQLNYSRMFWRCHGDCLMLTAALGCCVRADVTEFPPKLSGIRQSPVENPAVPNGGGGGWMLGIRSLHTKGLLGNGVLSSSEVRL